MWSSFLVSSALSVFLNRGSCEVDVGVHEESKGRRSISDCDQEHDVCEVSPTARMDLSSANVTPVAVMSSACDVSVSAALSVQALSSQLSEMHQVRGAAAAAAAAGDGVSLVHRAAGASFVRHVLSKGNSVDVWQGFLSFIGESSRPTCPPMFRRLTRFPLRRPLRPNRFPASARAGCRRCRIHDERKGAKVTRSAHKPNFGSCAAAPCFATAPFARALFPQWPATGSNNASRSTSEFTFGI